VSKNKIRLVTIEDPNSSFSETYRSIRTNIEYSSIDKPLRIVNCTSSLPNEAKTTTACNLAVMSANKFKRVLLVDLDLRNPTVHKAFNIKNKLGITNLLVDFAENGDQVGIEKYLNKIVNEHIAHDLFVITAGSEVVNPTEIIGSKKIRELFQMLRSHFDFVLIDSSPSAIIADGVIASTIGDGTIFIVESGRAKIEVVQRTLEKLKNVNVTIVGVVLTKVPASEIKDDYYYGYGNQKGHKRSDDLITINNID